MWLKNFLLKNLYLIRYLANLLIEIKRKQVIQVTCIR
jgi:hypothetical protein